MNQSSSLSSTAASSSIVEDMANVGGPTMLKRTLGLQNDRYSKHIGATTDFEPALLNVSQYDTQDETVLSRGTLRKVSDRDAFLLLSDSATPQFDQIVKDAEAIEDIVAPHGRNLVNLFFKTVHPSFPVLQKHVFLEGYERDYRETSPPLLAAVYLLALNWWDHCDELSSHPRPDASKLEKLLRYSLADAMARPKLSLIQAGLLLSQRPNGDQWVPTAQLVAVGQEVGLHLDCAHWKIPPWEKGLRKRLAWALYMQDKWGSLIHGRPSHIFHSNWAVRGLTSNDFPDVEWDESDPDEKHDIEKGRLIFTRFVHLSQIIAEILETFYSLQAMHVVDHAGAQGAHLILSHAKPIQLKLKEWYGSLPPVIRLESFSTGLQPNEERPSSIGYLHLGYFAAEITLHRRIVRSMSSNSPSVDSYIQHICRSAAKARLISAMDFVNRLTPNHLRSFWYFASKASFALIGTFGSLLWATSPAREEADWYRRRLAEYRWTLSVSSQPGEGKSLTEFAMTMLDLSTGLVKQLPEKPMMSRVQSAAEFSGPGGLASLSNIPSLVGSFSHLPSTEGSSVHSLGATDDESSEENDDDEMNDFARHRA